MKSIELYKAAEEHLTQFLATRKGDINTIEKAFQFGFQSGAVWMHGEHLKIIQYEYLKAPNVDKFSVEELNSIGQQGWELISVIENGSDGMHNLGLFRKEIRYESKDDTGSKASKERP